MRKDTSSKSEDNINHINTTNNTHPLSVPFHEPYTISNNEQAGMTQLHLNENLFVDSELFIANSCQCRKTGPRQNTQHLYPPSGNRIIREAAATVFGFSVDEVFPAAGASHALNLLLLRFASIYRKIILPSPTWGYYRICAKALDIKVVDVKMKVKDNQFIYDIAELDSALAIHGPAILLLSTPNNPTGNSIDYQDIEKLASNNPASMVIIDEAYFGFTDIDPGAASTLAHAHDNIIIVRSLSKAYGLAGLRIGFALASGFAKNAINNFFLPFGLPKYVQEIAANRLKDKSFLQNVRTACAEGYDALVSGLAENFLITAYRSHANFCLINVPSGTAKVYFNQLKKNGYLIKYHSDSFLRITIAQPQIMRHVANILNKGI